MSYKDKFTRILRVASASSRKPKAQAAYIPTVMKLCCAEATICWGWGAPPFDQRPQVQSSMGTRLLKGVRFRV